MWSLALIAQEAASTQQVQQTNNLAWTGVALAIGTAIVALFQSANNRKRDMEKAQLDRLTAKDKMEFDSKLSELKHKTETCERERAELAEEHKVDIEELRKKLLDSEKKNERTNKRLDEIMKLIVKRNEEYRKWKEEVKPDTEKPKSNPDTQLQ